MKKRALIGIAFAVIVIAGFVIYKHHQSSANPVENSIWVKTTKVQERNFPKEIHAIGTLTAHSVEIIPELAGHIDKVNFADGASVKKGDVLIQLDNAIYKAKNDSARARLRLSEHNHSRILLLANKGIISKQALDQTESELNERRAENSETAAMLSKTRLVAPFDGVVGKSNVSVGDYVDGGQRLVTLTDIKHLRIEYNLPEKQLAFLKSGQQVNVTTASYPGKSFTGTVSFISPTIDTGSRTISMYADLINDNKLLAPGMFVDVSHSLGMDEKVLFVPERSLMPILDGQQVYKIVDGKAYAVTAVIGKRLNGNVQIVNGLTRDDVVVTDGQMKLKSGMSVKIKT